VPKIGARQSLCARLSLPSAAARLELPARNAVRSRLFMLLDQPLGLLISTRGCNRIWRTWRTWRSRTCAPRPSTGRTQCTRGPSGHGAHLLTAKTRHCAMSTRHKPSDVDARQSGCRNLGRPHAASRAGTWTRAPEAASEAASVRPIPAHATANPGALA